MDGQDAHKDFDTEFAEIVEKLTDDKKVILRDKIQDLLQNPLYVGDRTH